MYFLGNEGLNKVMTRMCVIRSKENKLIFRVMDWEN